jgi:hypothetical protein
MNEPHQAGRFNLSLVNYLHFLIRGLSPVAPKKGSRASVQI